MRAAGSTAMRRMDRSAARNSYTHMQQTNLVSPAFKHSHSNL